MNPDQKLQHMLQTKGYQGEFKQAMQQFIRDRIQNGQYTQVFSSHQPEPEPEPEQTECIALTEHKPKPWYKRLFS